MSNVNFSWAFLVNGGLLVEYGTKTPDEWVNFIIKSDISLTNTEQLFQDIL